ncbi:hypothetical protein E2C01_046278 [Portunus trituberculatus]|uniref:Uncharacterized protein n=1 Tax=Portunus trituberculatus TaxID=210409 RepID=A0A5B7G4C2_PORTR|nr:hypothetical protein [Portunus trituberculatus]
MKHHLRINKGCKHRPELVAPLHKDASLVGIPATEFGIVTGLTRASSTSSNERYVVDSTLSRGGGHLITVLSSSPQSAPPQPQPRPCPASLSTRRCAFNI